MPKVSIIVPAYNSERTLARCLAGLVNQTLSDIEIILVNDCSTDGTLKIMTDCEAQFPEKIIVVNLAENLGAGGARNVALQYASGEYIGFVDSDDEVVTTMYEKLYSVAASNELDIVDGGYFDEATDNAIVHTSDELTGILDDRKRSELIASGGYFVSKIIKKSLIDELGIQFRSHCVLEDCETLMLIFAKAKSIGNVKEILYCYKYYKNSFSRGIDNERYYIDVTAAIEAVYNTLSPLPNYAGIKMAVEYAIVNFCALLVEGYRDIIKSSRQSTIEGKLRKISGYLHNMVSIPLDENIYVKNKISRETIKLIKEIM
jgi:glycosyltransferase involved in cell wall biosynthesis